MKQKFKRGDWVKDEDYGVEGFVVGYYEDGDVLVECIEREGWTRLCRGGYLTQEDKKLLSDYTSIGNDIYLWLPESELTLVEKKGFDAKAAIKNIKEIQEELNKISPELLKKYG